MLDLTFGEQVKIILSRKGMTIKELAETIEKRTGKKMSRQNLTQRLGRDNFQEQDMRMIAEILGCPFQLSILGDNISSEKSNNNIEENVQTDKADNAGSTEVPVQPQAETYERDITIGELVDIHEELDAMIAEEGVGEPEEYIGEVDAYEYDEEPQEEQMAGESEEIVKSFAEEYVEPQSESVEELLQEIEDIESERKPQEEEKKSEEKEEEEQLHGWKAYLMRRKKKRTKEQEEPVEDMAESSDAIPEAIAEEISAEESHEELHEEPYDEAEEEDDNPELKYLRLTMPKVNDDRRKLLLAAIAAIDEQCKVNHEKMKVKYAAELTTATMTEKASDADEAKKLFEQLFDNYKRMRERMTEEQKENVNKAYMRYARERAREEGINRDEKGNPIGSTLKLED